MPLKLALFLLEEIKLGNEQAYSDFLGVQLVNGKPGSIDYIKMLSAPLRIPNRDAILNFGKLIYEAHQNLQFKSDVLNILDTISHSKGTVIKLTS